MLHYTAPRFKSGKGKSIRTANLKRQKDKEKAVKLLEVKYKIALITLFSLSFLFLVGYFFYNRANKNFASADSYKSSYLQDDMYPAFSYIVIDGFNSDPIKLKKINFVILDKESKKVLIYDIPLNVSIEVPGKYSSSEFSKVFALGGLNNKDPVFGGIDLVNLSLFKIFAFKVDNYILVDSSLEKDLDSFVYNGSLSLNLTNLKDLKQSFKTNFSLNSFYRIHLFLKVLPEDRFIKRNLTKEQVENPTYIDDEFRDLTLSSNISQEKKTVSVLNGTDYAGIAHLGSRLVKNMGGRVVSIDNSSKTYDKSMIVADDLDSVTVKYLAHVFKIEDVVKKEDATNLEDTEFIRSNIVLILGFDLAKILY